MPITVTLLSRADCCLCDAMKLAVEPVVREAAVDFEVRDVDADPTLQMQFGDQVPVLLINGRKAFKYRVDAAALRRRLAREAAGRPVPRWRRGFSPPR